jgi:precorrin-6A/cobalt-precorrin-6A reductase
MMKPAKLLILGGSGEAADLARALQGDTRFDVTLSLAGRTSEPVALPGKLRKGGFGGAEGLAHVLAEERFDLLVDATHPFAVQMKANAVEAGKIAGTKFLAIRRPPWVPREGDRWIMVESLEAAAAAIGEDPRRVFLTTGRMELAPFRAAPQHLYIVRSVEAPLPEDLPPLVELITARGPFNVADERALIEAYRIELIVTKNSGGAGAAAKLDAARALSLPVIMVERPDLAEAPSVETVAEALAWLERVHGSTSSA